ncbi:hypothetical protein OOJ96_19850 [Pseudomonas sp. 15FMM2]|uniref:Uncharacterized protein n=1 Tax=Pseudomonas imrae TaxID=2992837 RepID=A0ACC7PLV6_9PSED
MQMPQYTLYLLLGALAWMPCFASTLALQPAGTTADGRNRYLITSVSATNARVNGFMQMAHGILWIKDLDGVMSQCGTDQTGRHYPECTATVWYQPVTCGNAAQAISMFGRLVGNIIYYDGNGVAKWQFHCASQQGNGWAIEGQVSTAPKPPPVSCTSPSTEIMMQGRIGSRVADTANVYIHCDSKASLKLSISNGGRVQLSGSGEVQLKFPLTGEAVLNVTGTDPIVRIDGELTKSPTTAGTYRGSTVLRIDVL